MSEVKAGIGGEYYQPYAERTGGESVVFFTRDLSAEGLKKAYAAIQGNLTGKVAVKLHTGEQNGPNIIPRPWVKSLMEQIPNSTIVETNTYYEGDRYTTAQHRETSRTAGFSVKRWRTAAASAARIPPSASVRQGRAQHSGVRVSTNWITGSTLARYTSPAPVRSAPSTQRAAAPR